MSRSPHPGSSPGRSRSPVPPVLVTAAVVGLATGAWAAVTNGGIAGPMATAPGASRHQAPAPPGLAQWPSWRGPLGTGVAPLAEPPTVFSAERNLRWKTPIPGRGFSTPVVWGDHVFVTTAVPAEEARRGVRDRRRGRRRGRRGSIPKHSFDVLALELDTGRVRWRRTAVVARPHEGYHPALSSFANASPVTDGERVYAFFGSRGLYAFDLDGNPVWERDFGVEMRVFNRFGESSSPALHDDTIVVLFDHEGQSFLEAVDKHTGKRRWRRLRDEATSWSSPAITVHEGRPVVITSGGDQVRAYDLKTGEGLWHVGGMTPHPVPTPVAGDGLVFAASGSSERRLRVIRLGARGDLAGTDAVVWTLDRAAPYNPSPLLWGGILYLVRDGGLQTGSSRLSAFDARTGSVFYLEEKLPLGVTVKASPVGAAGRIYLCTEEGNVIVVRHGPELEVLAVNDLGERFIASPAVVGNRLVLRGDRHVFCVARPEDPVPPARDAAGGASPGR